MPFESSNGSRPSDKSRTLQLYWPRFCSKKIEGDRGLPNSPRSPTEKVVITLTSVKDVHKSGYMKIDSTLLCC